MHTLSDELQSLPAGTATDAARLQALRLERRELLSVHRELLVALYVAVATLVAGVGLLVEAHLERIGPVALLAGICAASTLCYGVALRAHFARRERSLGEDYLLLLGTLLFSAAVGYAEARFRILGAAWSRHLLLLAVWHLAVAYLSRSRLVLAVALTAFAGWLGVEARLGTVLDPLDPRFGAGPRSLICAAVFLAASYLHRDERAGNDAGFRDVYRQFAANLGFWGALALMGDAATRWIGAATLLALALLVGATGLRERRESFLLYAVGYATAGLVWLEALVLRDTVLASWIGLFTVGAAVLLLLTLRGRLKASAS